MIKIRNQKDFAAGALYLFVGLAAVAIAQRYPVGTATRMGPGYFPLILGSLLILLGAFSLLRSFISPGQPIGAIAWKPLLAIPAGTALFAYLLPRMGLPVALLALILVSAAVSDNFRFSWRATAAMAVLIAFCVVVFVELLGVPLPMLGKWLAG